MSHKTAQTPKGEVREKAVKPKKPRQPKKKPNKNAKAENDSPPKKTNCEAKKPRGPIVHVEGPLDSIINAPVQEKDCDAKKDKKLQARQKILSAELQGCVDLKYDTQSQDAPWICAFCKRVSHTNEFASNEAGYIPGDLFGPYFITGNCEEFDRRIGDPHDKQFRSKTVSRCLASVPALTEEDFTAPGAYRELCNHEWGITKVSAKYYEVWAHEDCIIWSPGITLAGPNLTGLDEAIWMASNVSCTLCHARGANISCLKRGCPHVMHVGCAHLAQWTLDTETYHALCSTHSPSDQDFSIPFI